MADDRVQAHERPEERRASDPSVDAANKDIDIEEKDVRSGSSHSSAVEGASEPEVSKARKFFQKYRIFFHRAAWLVMTG